MSKSIGGGKIVLRSAGSDIFYDLLKRRIVRECKEYGLDIG